jgi:hypothetical protein
MQDDLARSDKITEGKGGGEHIKATKKPTVLFGFCCGRGIPAIDPTEEARGHYTFCPVWQRAVEANEERSRRLYEMPQRPGILGEDPEIEARILDKDPEEVIAKYDRLKKERPDIAEEVMGGEMLQGDAAVLAAGKEDSEWGE